MRLLLLLLGLVLLASDANAQVYRFLCESVRSVPQPGYQCQTWPCSPPPRQQQRIVDHGTAVCIGLTPDRKSSVFLTCSHNIQSRGTCFIVDSRKYIARVRRRWSSSRTNETVDLAVVEVDSTHFDCIPLATPTEATGGSATLYSFPGSGSRIKRTRCSLINDQTYHGSMPEQGESGGPLVQNGKVVGILWGHDYSTGRFTARRYCRGAINDVYGSYSIPLCSSSPPLNPPSDPPSDPGLGDALSSIATLIEDHDKRLGKIEEDVDAVRNRLEGWRSLPIVVVLEDDDGNELDRDTFQPGEEIRINRDALLRGIEIPVTLIDRTTGKVVGKQSYPLQSGIVLEVKPEKLPK